MAMTHANTSRLCRHSAQTHTLSNASVISVCSCLRENLSGWTIARIPFPVVGMPSKLSHTQLPTQPDSRKPRMSSAATIFPEPDADCVSHEFPIARSPFNVSL